MCSNRIYNRLGGLFCGRVAGCSPRFLCLIAAESALEICLGISVVGLAGSCVGTGAALLAGSLEKFPSLLFYALLLLFSISIDN